MAAKPLILKFSDFMTRLVPSILGGGGIPVEFTKQYPLNCEWHKPNSFLCVLSSDTFLSFPLIPAFSRFQSITCSCCFDFHPTAQDEATFGYRRKLLFIAFADQIPRHVHRYIYTGASN
jgi:hypothetical protein